MKPVDIQADESLRHREFPVARQRIYLAHAGVCPLPRRVAQAVRLAAENAMDDDQEAAFRGSFIADTREVAARLLGAGAEEIALVGPTSVGLSTVARGLQFRRGDNVVCYFDDYPSNVYPWMALADQGVEVRLVNSRELGQIRPVDVQSQVDERTRLVALASCHFISGYRLEVDEIGRYLRDQGVLFCLDAIQTTGAFPVSVQYVDFLATDAHKWLLGPTAAGILYVRRSIQDRLRPWAYGWHNVRCPDFVAAETLVLRTDARRYEAGSQNLLGLVGLRAALDLLEEVGVEAVARDLLYKRNRLSEALTDLGCELLNPTPSPTNASGIISFRPRAGDTRQLHARLSEAGVVASLRTDRAGRHWVRFSPHYYNTDAELDIAVGVVRQFSA